MRAKFLKVSIIAIFIILITYTVFAATGTVDLKADAKKVKRGDTFTVTLYATSEDGINGIDTKYSYDSEKLELISEELVNSTKWSSLGTAPDITVICNATESIKNADIYALKFKVRDNASVGDILKVETTEILLDTDVQSNSEVLIPSKKIEIEVEKKMSKIEVTTKPTKTNYIQNYEELDLTGGVLTVTYDDNSTDKINLNDKKVKVTGFNNSNVGKNIITVEYGGKTTTFDITIETKKLSKLQITTKPTKTEYLEGENFNSSGMKVIAIYNDTTSKEIANYLVTDGNNLSVEKTNVTISYTEGNITKTIKQGIKVLEKLKVEFEDLNEIINNAKKYIENVKSETTVIEFINKIKTNGTVQIFKDNDEITNNETKIATGMKLEISLNKEKREYIVVVRGDTNGDGECNLRDLLQLNKHRLNKTQLKDEFFLAGDVNQDNEIDLKDILKMNKYRLGKLKSL